MQVKEPILDQHEGLMQIVQHEIRDELLVLVPLWQSEPPADHQRVVRPTGDGSFSVYIEPYRGVSSWINFRKKIIERENLSKLDAIIRKNQPALFGYVSTPTGCQLIPDIVGLMVFLCQAAFKYIIDENNSVIDAVNRLIKELDQLLESGEATYVVLTALSGLKLPDGIDNIDLGNNVCIRPLTQEEIEEHGSNDISNEARYDFSSRFVTTALLITRKVSVTLNKQYQATLQDMSFHQEIQDQIDAVLCALHILKSGRVGVLASFTTIYPTVLPNMSGHSSAPLVVNPFTFMELTKEEIESFIILHQSVIENTRDEVRIASSRLLDAESRLSPVDALLDAVIGLEVLLNPNDYAELSFRVALNYAYLGDIPHRRKRYENIRDIQKTRNRVVHGGLNLRSKDAAVISDHTDLAKACLRDAVKFFLTDKEFAGNKKLDVEFWLDRVIPPNH